MLRDTSNGYGVYTSETSKAVNGIEPIDNLNGIVTIFSTKGVVNKPVFCSSSSVFSSIYGSSDIDGNYNIESAMSFLEEGNSCWVNRIGLGFEQYNLFDFDFTMSGDDTSFSGSESIFTAKSIANSLYVEGVTSDDIDIESIKTTTLPTGVNFRLYTKYPIPLTGYTISIEEDEDYLVSEVDTDDESYFPNAQVFRYKLLDKDGYVVGKENFLFSLVADFRDISTNRIIYMEEAFKQSSYFGAVFGELITDTTSGTTTFDTSNITIVEDCIAVGYDYTDLSSITVNPVSFFFNDRSSYPAKVMFEGGYDGNATSGIKKKMSDWMKSCTKSRGDELTFYDTNAITNAEYQTIVYTIKNNLSTILATSFSYERDVITSDWGEFIYDGKTYYKPDSWKTASDQLNSYRNYIVEPAFGGSKSFLAKDYLAPVLNVKRDQEPKLEKVNINFSRKLSTGYYPMAGITAHPKHTPERNIHVQWLKIFMLDVAERVLEPFIGQFNNTNTQKNIENSLDEAFQPIKEFLDGDIQMTYTKVDDDSIEIEVGIKPTGAIKYIYFNISTYDDVDVMTRDFS